MPPFAGSIPAAPATFFNLRKLRAAFPNVKHCKCFGPMYGNAMFIGVFISLAPIFGSLLRGGPKYAGSNCGR